MTQLKSFFPVAGSTSAPQSVLVAQLAVQVIEVDAVQAPVGPETSMARHCVPLSHSPLEVHTDEAGFPVLQARLETAMIATTLTERSCMAILRFPF
jgi:hypothetical protein